MLRKITHAALLAGVLLAPAEALAGGWRGFYDRPHGGWRGYEAHRGGCWRWWYGRWIWAC